MENNLENIKGVKVLYKMGAQVLFYTEKNVFKYVKCKCSYVNEWVGMLDCSDDILFCTNQMKQIRCKMRLMSWLKWTVYKYWKDTIYDFNPEIIRHDN